jgi:hypothetical protein
MNRLKAVSDFAVRGRKRTKAIAASVLLLSGLVAAGGAGSFQQIAEAQTVAPPAATIDFSVNVRQSFVTAVFGSELTCQNPSQPVSIYTAQNPAVLPVVPNTSCQLRMVPYAGMYSRTGRTSFRSTINGVTTVLPSFLGTYEIPVGAAGTVTTARFDFDFDVANLLDVALDLFEQGGQQPWSTWFGSSTVSTGGFFFAQHQVLGVRSVTGFRTAKRVAWVAGLEPKLELFLGLRGFQPSGFLGTATVQYFDLNSRKLSEEVLKLSPASTPPPGGYVGTSVMTTITKPAKTAFILVGLSSQADFGVDSFRLTKIPSPVSTTTTLPPSTTTSTSPSTTTTKPTTTTTPPTTTPGNSTKSISSPVNNSVVGTIVRMQINDAANVARVDWYVNSIPVGSDITPADPFTFNALGWGPGPFTIKAVVVDGSFKETTTRTVSFSIG